MAEGTNPVVPAGWELAIQSIGVLYVGFVIVAVFSLARNKTLTPAVKFLCLLGILAFPFLGPAAWFLHLFRSRSGRKATESPAGTDRAEKIIR